MNAKHEVAYRLDPALWMQDVLGIKPHNWQKTFLRAPRGSSVCVLSARQVGKTTAAAAKMAHVAIFMPGSLSVIACPAQSQSAEALRKVRQMVIKAGASTNDNVYKLELDNGSRVIALPGTHESIRGLTVEGLIVADEAAQLDPAIMAALHPMRTQCPNAQFVMLSTAWSRNDPFWATWAGDDPSWIRIDATLGAEPNLIAPEVVERARRQLSEADFKREYMGIPAGSQVSPFTFEQYERATKTPVHSSAWHFSKPTIIGHDVGYTKDRSTAVIAGLSEKLAPGLIHISEFDELPLGLSGDARADALALYDARYNHKAVIIADLTYDPSYADALVERFGERVIGLQITSHGETGENFDVRYLKKGRIRVYKVSRTYLLELLRRELDNDVIRIRESASSLRMFEQLVRLDVEFKMSRMIYKCPAGRNDDLAMSTAMAVWAAQHPHLPGWCWALEPRIRPAWQSTMPVGGWT